MAAIVGIHDPRATLGEAAQRAAVSRGLPELQPDATISLGPLTVAWKDAHGSARVGLEGPLCVLDGYVSNLAELAEAAGLPADGAADRLLGSLHARLGDSLLPRLRGDFVLLVWYPDTQTGIVARDQIGARSLVMHADGDRLRFASESRELLRMIPSRPPPDDVAMAHWLSGTLPPDDRTLYAGVRRLKGGHFVRLERGGHSVHRYWSPKPGPILRVSREEAAERLRAAVVRAVERRSRGESAAVLMSGGLDSSTVAACAAQLLPEHERAHSAYSAIFPLHKSVDESALIERLAHDLRLPTVRIAVEGGSVLAGAVEYLQRFELPPTSPNLFFWLPLLRRARADGVTALLDGEGGDEVFGFSPYLIADRLSHGRLVSMMRLAGTLPGDQARPTLRRLLRRAAAFGAGGLALPPALRRARRSLRQPEHEARAWLRDETAQAYFDTDELWLWKQAPGPRWAAELAQRFTWSGGWGNAFDHLRQRASLAGLDSRHPLTDVDLLELVLRLPPEFAFDRRFSRPLIREAMAGILPDEVRLRPDKSTFDEVFQEGLRTHDFAVARKLLTARGAAIGAYARPEVIRRDLLDNPPDRGPLQNAGWALDVWRLLTTECWLQEQSQPGFTAELVERGGLVPPRYELLDAGSRPSDPPPFSTLTI